MRALDSVPSVRRPRNNFNKSHRVAMTMKVGLLHPVDIVEVLPGETWRYKPASLSRLSTTLIRPIMDDMYLDTYSFFVPLRILYDKLENVFGDVKPSAYADPELATIPGIPPTTSFEVTPGSVADYLGLPSSIVAPQDVYQWGFTSVMPFRGLAFIYNEYINPQSVGQPVNIHFGEWDPSEVPNGNPWSPTNYTGMLPPVRRYGDLYSTCLPAPQKGPAVKIPGFGSDVPVVTRADSIPGATSGLPGMMSFVGSGSAVAEGDYVYMSRVRDGSIFSPVVGFTTTDPTSPNYSIRPVNLWADPSGIDDANINNLRTAFQLQKYLERDAIYGSRYREYLYAAFGVTSPDARMQIPEFLGGSHNRLNIAQIPSMSSATNYEVGQYAANINSLSEKSGKFTKSFTEHGYIITVACIRYKHLYSQSVNRLWRREDRNDFYDPLFAHLGMQAITKRDVWPFFNPGTDDEQMRAPIGYNEAFADYRTIPDRVAGQMRPEAGNIGQYWSLADYYETGVTLQDLVWEDTETFNRVVSATDDLIDPFVVDFFFECSVASTVSRFGSPGFADH